MRLVNDDYIHFGVNCPFKDTNRRRFIKPLSPIHYTDTRGFSQDVNDHLT